MKFISSIIFLFVLNAAIAQDSLKSTAKANLNLTGLAASYELPVSNRFLLETSLGTGFGNYADKGVGVFGDSGQLLVIKKPRVFSKAEFKYIYNRSKRVEKGDEMNFNTGNYIALQTKLTTGNKDYSKNNPTLISEIHWGSQRQMFKSKFLFSTDIGLGHIYDFENKVNVATLAIGLEFSYLFHVRRK